MGSVLVGSLADVEDEETTADGLDEAEDEGSAVDFTIEFDAGTGIDEHDKETPEHGGDEMAVEIAGYPADENARNDNPGNSDQE